MDFTELKKKKKNKYKFVTNFFSHKNLKVIKIIYFLPVGRFKNF